MMTAQEANDAAIAAVERANREIDRILRASVGFSQAIGEFHAAARAHRECGSLEILPEQAARLAAGIQKMRLGVSSALRALDQMGG